MSTPAPITATKDHPAPRPRLVAKSGSGLRDAMPKAKNSTNNMGRGSGPDPNQVWNRNRRKYSVQGNTIRIQFSDIEQRYNPRLQNSSRTRN